MPSNMIHHTSTLVFLKLSLIRHFNEIFYNVEMCIGRFDIAYIDAI